MSFSSLIKKEIHIVLYGQSTRFRLAKYAILIPLFGAIYFRWGWGVTWKTLLTLALLGIVLHFTLRYLTDSWTKAWGPFRPIDDMPQ